MKRESQARSSMPCPSTSASFAQQEEAERPSQDVILSASRASAHGDSELNRTREVRGDGTHQSHRAEMDVCATTPRALGAQRLPQTRPVFVSVDLFTLWGKDPRGARVVSSEVKSGTLHLAPRVLQGPDPLPTPQARPAPKALFRGCSPRSPPSRIPTHLSGRQASLLIPRDNARKYTSFAFFANHLWPLKSTSVPNLSPPRTLLLSSACKTSQFERHFCHSVLVSKASPDLDRYDSAGDHDLEIPMMSPMINKSF